MSARLSSNGEPLANARGSERSHDRKGVVSGEEGNYACNH
jgi:hypothetical protein